MKKRVIVFLAYTVFGIVLLPALVTGFCRSNFTMAQNENPLPGVITETGAEETVPLPLDLQQQEQTPLLPSEENLSMEDYIKGVVGAEMPASFEMEALKAQAVAARTYAYRQLSAAGKDTKSQINPDEIGQAYMSQEELKQKWGGNFDIYYEKISQAVEDTKGQIMIYDGEPILAAFHSTSSGVTEDAVNVWSEDLPYLRSVDSSQDENAPDFITAVEIPVDTVVSKLQSVYPDLIVTESNLLEQIQIGERTESGTVKKIQIGNLLLTGRQVREALGLRSANFSISQEGENLIFTTKGYGHGAGMSQYGANFMAQEGCDYKEILAHYYQGVQVVTENEN